MVNWYGKASQLADKQTKLTTVQCLCTKIKYVPKMAFPVHKFWSSFLHCQSQSPLKTDLLSY